MQFVYEKPAVQFLRLNTLKVLLPLPISQECAEKVTICMQKGKHIADSRRKAAYETVSLTLFIITGNFSFKITFLTDFHLV